MNTDARMINTDEISENQISSVFICGKNRLSDTHFLISKLALTFLILKG
jgi:hypothetical protein